MTDMSTTATDRYIHTFKGTDGKWYFTFIGDNGEAVGGSAGEGYERPNDMHDTIDKYFPGWRVMIETKNAQEMIDDGTSG